MFFCYIAQKLHVMKFLTPLLVAFACLALSQNSSAQPVISSLSNRSAVPGSSITISGSGFNTTASNNIVFFGATRASVSSASASSLTVNVPTGATFSPVFAINSGSGASAFSPYPFLPSHDTAGYITAAINFANREDFTATYAKALAIGDIDGDGKPDIVAGNGTVSTISVFRNTSTAGTLSFAPKVDFACVASSDVTKVKIHDLDGDGKPEILVGYSSSTSIGIFKNTATSGVINAASLASRVDFGISSATTSIAVADIDMDGKPDIVAGRGGVMSAAILRNTSTVGTINSSSFATLVAIPTHNSAQNLAVADIDGDGKPDLVTANNSLNSISILRNISSPGSISTSSFSAYVDYPVSTQMEGLVVADVDGDNKLDVVVSGIMLPTLAILRNTATAGTIDASSLSSAVSYTTTIAPRFMAAGDFNGDRKVDFALSHASSPTRVTVFTNKATPGSISTGSLSSALTFANDASPVYPAIAIGDLDGDLRADIVVGVDGSPQKIGILRNLPVAPNTGDDSVCVSATVTLSNSTTGGTWSSSATAIGTVNATTGVVRGIAPGTVTISYNLPGGTVTTDVTVLGPPSAGSISGTAAVCVGSTSPLSSTVSGGTWSSSNTTVASVSGTGLVSALSSGTSTISYSVTGICGSATATREVTVAPIPAAIVTPAAATSICLGESVTANVTGTLLYQDFNSGMAGWTVSNIMGSPVNYWQIVTPSTSVPLTAGDGSAMLQANSETAVTDTRLTSPSFSTLGYSSATLSFNQYLISIAPDLFVGLEYSTNGGTTWIMLNDQTNLVYGTGSWTPSAPEFSLSLPAGALNKPDVKLRWRYQASTLYWFLDNIKVVASAATYSYLWSGPGGLSCATCSSPSLTPATAGANIYSVTTTSGAGCSTTSTITVNASPLPTTISGSLNVCVAATSSLTNATGGGTWESSNGSVATISSSGLLTAVTAGTAIISYTLPTGCRATAIATVTATPSVAAITGVSSLCAATNTPLTSATSGGTWTSSNTAIATVNSSGLVSAIIGGTVEISYQVSNTCGSTVVTRTLTVNPLTDAGTVTGTSAMCVSDVSTLSASITGGTWSSGNTAVATVNSSGLVSAVSGGTVTISYSVSGTCGTTTATKAITVTALPSAGTISGALGVCLGSTTSLSSTTSGGTWSSGSVSIATVGSNTGIVNGLAFGTAEISYSVTNGCGSALQVATVTVNPVPVASIGTVNVCVGSTQTVGSSGGGTWSSAATSIATVGSSTGIVTGILAGTTSLIYTLPTGCSTSLPVEVKATPVLSGPSSLCVGATGAQSVTVTGGTWVVTNTSIATVDGTGAVTAVASGTTSITYTAANGCSVQKVITVNNLPPAIAGSSNVCAGSTITLANSSTGTWSSGNTSIASVGSSSGIVSGVATGGVAITFTSAVGCQTATVISVNSVPAAITGFPEVCAGLTTSLSSATPGGTWSSGNTAVAMIGSSSGMVSAGTAGTSLISYTTSNGCASTRLVTVRPNPAAIGGSLQLCQGAASPLLSSSGGIWVSSNTAIVTVSATGVLTGVAAGTADVSYILPTGCSSSAVATVNPLPSSVSGTSSICIGSSATLTSSPSGGTWASSNTNLSIGSASGIITGILAGTSTVTYTLPTGCRVSMSLTINPLPSAITGISSICLGNTTSLASTPSGGTWSSSGLAIGSISAVGVFAGYASGTSLVSYTLPTGCMATFSVTVNSLPLPITGSLSICIGSTSALISGPLTGTWSSGSSAIATVSTTSGLATGVSVGTTSVTFTNLDGCIRSAIVTVNPLPEVISGAATICEGLSTTMSSTSTGGSWSSSNPSTAVIGSSSGIVTGVIAGSAVISYFLPTGCYRTHAFTVHASPTPISGPDSVCQGSDVTLLTTTTPGGTWTASSSVASVSASGIVTGVTPGSVNITYTNIYGCSAVHTMTVNPLPDAGTVSGADTVCVGTTIVKASSASSGTWTSSNASVASVLASSGVVSGITTGTAVISYSVTNSCGTAVATANVTVINVLADAGSISGPDTVCQGDNIVVTTGAGGGAWSSTNPSIATVNTAGVVSGLSPGTALIRYIVSTLCNSDTATKIIFVKASADCGAFVSETGNSPLKLTILPNPSDGLFHILTPVDGMLKVQGIDGKVILERHLSKNGNDIQLSQDIASGLYICHFIGENGISLKAQLVLTGR